MKNYLTNILLVLIVSLDIITIFEVTNYHEKVIEKPKIEYKNKEVILFTGDSITDYYDLSIYFKYDDKEIINSGISGYKTTDILRRFDNVIKQYNADKMFIMIGTNDIAAQRNYDDIVNDSKEILLKTKTVSPKTKIYYLSIYPINEKVKGSKANKRKNSFIRDVNSEMKKFCENNNITYIDIYSVLKDKDNRLKEAYTKDGLHLNSRGYEEVTKLLKEYIEK